MERYTIHDIEDGGEDLCPGETFTREEAHEQLATMFFYDFDADLDPRRPEEIPLDELLANTHIELRAA